MQETGPAANRKLSVFGTISDAWKLTYGAKWAIWAPMLVGILTYLFAVLVGAGSSVFIADHFTDNKPVLFALIALGVIVAVGIIYLVLGLFSGTIRVAIDRARGNPISSKTGFHSFSRVVPILLTFLCLIPFMVPQFLILLIIDAKQSPYLVQTIQTIYGILLAPLFFIAIPLAVDKTNSPITAIRRSLTIGWNHWLKLVGIMVVVELLSLLAMLPMQVGTILKNHEIALVGGVFLLIVYIWLLPFLYLIQGTIYHKLID